MHCIFTAKDISYMPFWNNSAAADGRLGIKTILFDLKFKKFLKLKFQTFQHFRIKPQKRKILGHIKINKKL